MTEIMCQVDSSWP